MNPNYHVLSIRWLNEKENERYKPSDETHTISQIDRQSIKKNYQRT